MVKGDDDEEIQKILQQFRDGGGQTGLMREAHGIFARVGDKEQFFGSVTKKKNAIQICRRRSKRYNLRFYTKPIWTTE